MSEQMAFVYVEATGHVLAVVTCVATPKAALTTADLATPTLMVRNLEGASHTRFDLTPDLLKVFTGNRLDAALLEPRGYGWDPMAKQIQSLPYGQEVTATFDAVSITVNLGQKSSGPTKVLVAYPGPAPSKSVVAPGIVADGSQTVKISVGQLAAGTPVLMLAAGYPPIVAKKL
jgi:hypothetical protein